MSVLWQHRWTVVFLVAALLFLLAAAADIPSTVVIR